MRVLSKTRRARVPKTQAEFARYCAVKVEYACRDWSQGVCARLRIRTSTPVQKGSSANANNISVYGPAQPTFGLVIPHPVYAL